jgi:LysR family carnitine catabolism transcriptional activator
LKFIGARVAALHPLRPNAVFEVEHLATARGLVEAGLGISVEPSLTLFHFHGAALAHPRSLPLLTRSVRLIDEQIGNRVLA